MTIGDNKIINELLRKKSASKKEFADYVNQRIKMLDEESENVIISDEQNNMYNGYVGKNVKVSISRVLLENVNISLPRAYMQFDGDERIVDFLYDNIQDGEVANLIVMLQSLLPMVFMDSFKSMVQTTEREKIYDLNARSGRVTKYSEIKNAQHCKCSEHAALFHNICKILDIDSTLVAGTIEKNGILEGHAYNIIKTTNKIFLVDLSNFMGKSDKGEKIPMIPIAALSDDDYNKLLNSQKVGVDMSILSNAIWQTRCEAQNDIYGVGMSKEDKNQLLTQNIINNKQMISDFLNQKPNLK